MFRNYITIAIRNLLRHRLFTGLNIFGLATGMACSILIFLWVQDERSYDRFNEQAASIYRMSARISGIDAAVVPVPIAAAARHEIPEVANATRLASLRSTITIGNQKFDEKGIYYTDSNFLRMFSYPLLLGDKASALTAPDGIVLTESTAIRYFGSAAQAMGKTVHIDNVPGGNTLIVQGVLQNLPANSHLQFDLLLSIAAYERMFSNIQEQWGNYDVYTYLQFNPSFKGTATAVKAMQQKLEGVLRKHDNSHTTSSLFLQPLTDVHLHSRLMLDVEGQGNNQHVKIFSIVAVFILLIACINFMNLSTALSARRAKEVGLRKTVGALRWQLIGQFLCESFVLSFVALGIGLLIAYALLPFFNTLAAKSISLNLLDARILLTILGVAAGVGLVSGSYPALFLSSFQPVKVLKGVKVLHGGKAFFRNGLVVLQFAISVILMVSTIVVYRQLHFINQRDIGYNKENLLYVPIPQVGDISKNIVALETILKTSPLSGSYSIISDLPTYLTTGTTNVEWTGKDPNNQVIFPQIWSDEHFLRLFGMKLLAGRYFDRALPTDQHNYVINETTMKVMGLTPSNAVGTEISMNNAKGQIIGVVKDFNFKPVQQAIEPLILKNTFRGTWFLNARMVVFKAPAGHTEQTIAQVKAAFGQVYSDHPLSFGFVDEDLSKLYRAEQRMGKLFNIFSVLSIIVSCLGLFGLTTFATQKRIREIGVRKILGASEAGIVAMLSKDFVKLVAVALIIAFPLAGWMMNSWLDNFVYRISLSWWIFAMAGLAALLIAFVTVSYQSIKAAVTSPVKSLRSE